jgi:predicted nucleotidyltransferase
VAPIADRLRGRIRIKKLFDLLRPLLAAKWIVDSGTLPPMTFEELLRPLQEAPDLALLQSIRRLEAAKAVAKEGELHQPEPLLMEFIEGQNERCRKAYEAMEDGTIEDKASVEAFFLAALEKWA